MLQQPFPYGESRHNKAAISMHTVLGWRVSMPDVG